MTVSNTPSVTKQPAVKHTLEGWQYSSKGQIPGITGNVDMNLWYGEIMSPPEVDRKNPYTLPEKVLRLKKIPRMRGNDVRWVQYHLVRLGFLTEKDSKGKSNIDGDFGPDTDEAVRKAQAHYGIAVDGNVGAVTVYVLRYN